MSSSPEKRLGSLGEYPMPRGRWLMVALLYLFMLTNFADKAVIGIAGVPIMRDLQLSPRQFGFVGSSFFLLFSVSTVLTGFLVNRVQTRWALLVMGLIWALSQFPMVGTVGLGTMVACRIILGAGEGPAWPVALHAAYKWFPNEQRTLATGVIALGGTTGILIAPPLLNLIIVHYSWHWAFGVLGIVGLAWTMAWLVFGREGTITDAAMNVGLTPECMPYRHLLLSPTIIASWCAFFGAYWGLTLALTWQPVFFVKGLGFAQQDVGLLIALPPALILIVEFAGGWYSKRLLASGISSRIARGMLGGLSVGLGGLALLIMPSLPTNALKIAAITIGTALPTLIYVVVPAVVSEITPTSQRGALLAIGNAIGTSAGLLAPYVMGSVVQTAAKPIDGFNTGFILCGAIMLVGGGIGVALMRPEREAMRRSAGIASQSRRSRLSPAGPP
jgi:MFS transporter, ACS family, D-galactonate transporter